MTGLWSQSSSLLDRLPSPGDRDHHSWDVTFYDLEVKVDSDMRRLAGTCVIHFEAHRQLKTLQVDLHPGLKVARSSFRGAPVRFERRGNTVLFTLPDLLSEGDSGELKIIFGGNPGRATEPDEPGLRWGTDQRDKDWFWARSRGGAHHWWPCKDDPGDKADSLRLAVILPRGVVALAPGNLQKVEKLPGEFVRHTWFTRLPISPEQVSIIAGNYTLDLKDYPFSGGKWGYAYYSLNKNPERTEKNLSLVTAHLLCVERLLGSYPFASENLKIIEVPAGLEGGQGQITLPVNLPEVGDASLPLTRALATNWYGAAVGAKEKEESWPLAAMQGYAHLFTLQCMEGEERMKQEIQSWVNQLQNQSPLSPSSGDFQPNGPHPDALPKGGIVLYMMRRTLDDDGIWYDYVQEFGEAFRFESLSEEEFFGWWDSKLGADLGWLPRYYAFNADLPVLEWRAKRKRRKWTYSYRWLTNNKAEFFYPVTVVFNEREEKLFPTQKWQSVELKGKEGRNIQIKAGEGLFRTLRVK